MNTGADIEITNSVSIDPRQIKLPDGNPNHMTAEQLESLRAFITRRGFLQPVLVTRNEGVATTSTGDEKPYTIIDGAHRTALAIRLDMPVIPTVIVSANEAERIRDRIAMNNLRGDLDLTAVAHDLEYLIKTMDDPAEISLTGYSSDDVVAMLEAVHTPTDLEQLRDEGVQPPPAEPEDKVKTFSMAIKFETELDRARVREAALELSTDGTLASGLVAMAKAME